MGTALLIGSALYLYANLFALSGTPFLLGGDQALFWTNAERLLHGELIYRDFLEFTPPGADLIYLGAFKLLGSKIWVPNLIVLVLGILLCGLCFRIAGSIMKPAQAALAAAMVVVFDYGKMLNATHHWFSMMAVLGAAAVLLEARTPARILIAGTLLGVAAFFTQTRGPSAALGIGAYLVCERFQTKQPWSMCVSRLALLFFPLAATWGFLSSYFIARVGFQQLWYFQVTYVLHYVANGSSDLDVASPQIRAWLGTPIGIEFLLVFMAVPIVYALSGWRCRRAYAEAPPIDASPAEAFPADARRAALLVFVGTALFLEVAQSPNWIRVYCVAVPGIILLVWLLAGGSTGRCERRAAALLWTGLIAMAAHQTWERHRQRPMIVALPAGSVATEPSTGGKLAWLAQHTAPGQFLFEARWVDVYLPLALRNPAFADMLEGGHHSRAEFIDSSVRQIDERRVRYIIWAPRLESPVYPFAKFREFLASRYQRIMTFPDQDEVWERRSSTAQ